MKLPFVIIIFFTSFVFPATPPSTQAAARDVIICGSGGDRLYTKKFSDWGERLRETLAKNRDGTTGTIALLGALLDESSTRTTPNDFSTIQTLFGKLEKEIGPEDDLFVYLIGHGSHWRGVSRFHVPGPDLTAEGVSRMLAPLDARRVVVVNAASASAGFINALSKEGRVICSATKSVNERNSTEFMEFFIQALEDGSADRNRDERVSVLEVCRQAADLTAAYYVGRGLIATEHALIDDNGDGQGARLSQDASVAERKRGPPASIDGRGAARCYLKDFSFPPEVPKSLIKNYLALLNSVEELSLKKSEMNEVEYYAGLEALLIKLSRANRLILQEEKHLLKNQ